MLASFLLVAFGRGIVIKLVGVAFSSLQCGIGEASMLGLTARYSPHTGVMLTAWSSGTGFAGVFGYAWVVLLHQVVGLSLPATLLAACTLVAAWLLVYFAVLQAPEADPGEALGACAGCADPELPSTESAASGTFLSRRSGRVLGDGFRIDL